MNIDDVRKICKSFPSVTEDIKWGHDLCFNIGGKMFVVVGLDEAPVSVSFKVSDDNFDELRSREGFMPAPYLARHKWIHVDDIKRMSRKELQQYTKQSYDLIKSKLPKKILNQLHK